MSALEIAITKLKSVSGVTALVPATRIYPIEASQDAVAPFIVVSLVSETDVQMLTGAGIYPESRVQVDCVAVTASDANAIGEAVKVALQDVTLETIAGHDATIYKGSSDFTMAADDRSAFQRSIDFLVRWR